MIRIAFTTIQISSVIGNCWCYYHNCCIRDSYYYSLRLLQPAITTRLQSAITIGNSSTIYIALAIRISFDNNRITCIIENFICCHCPLQMLPTMTIAIATCHHCQNCQLPLLLELVPTTSIRIAAESTRKFSIIDIAAIAIRSTATENFLCHCTIPRPQELLPLSIGFAYCHHY